MRLSLFSRLFSRKAEPVPVVPSRARNAAAANASLRSPSGAPPKPRLPLANAADPAPSAADAFAGGNDGNGVEGRGSADPTPSVADAAATAATAAPAPLIEKPPLTVVPVKPTPREEEVVRTTKMPPQEELSIKISEGLKSLSNVLGAIDEKLAAQTRSSELVAERLQALPRVLEGLVEAERTNLETMQALRTSMEKQAAASLQSAEKLDKIPGVVEGLGTRIQQQTEASAAVKTSVESVSQSVRGLVDGSQRAQNSLITEFRRGQDDQRQRLEDLVERQRRTTYIVAAIGVVVVIGLIIVLTRLPH